MPDPRPTIRYALFSTRFGTALAAFTDRGLCSLELGDDQDALRAALAARFPEADLTADNAGLAEITAAIADFFADPARVLDISLDPRGTEFQRKVWRALMDIPVGETRTYSDVARAIGRPDAVRAVASAVAANRLAVIVPCHRVLRKDGTLGGFQWGLERKAALLANEGVEL